MMLFAGGAQGSPEIDAVFEGLPVGAQGDRDVCSLFAVTALAAFEVRADLSEEFLIWAANESTGSSGDSAMFHEAVDALERFGICPERSMPYAATPDPSRRPPSHVLSEATALAHRWRVHWIRRWDVKRPMTDTELAVIRTVLDAGRPVAVGLRWPKVLGEASLIVVPAADQVFDGHSVVFVGYTNDPAIPGGGSFRFRNSFGPDWGDHGYGVMSYAYARAWTNDAVWLELVADRGRVTRLEAESLLVVAQQGCDAEPQGMAAFGGPMWSNQQQLFCGNRSGGRVELQFAVQESGRYLVQARATSAPDFGVVEVEVDGSPAGVFDLYAGRVVPAGALGLGIHVLEAGLHRITFASNSRFGIDTVELSAIGA